MEHVMEKERAHRKEHAFANRARLGLIALNVFRIIAVLIVISSVNQDKLAMDVDIVMLTDLVPVI